MLSAAQDILNKHKSDEPVLGNVTDTECITEISTRICSLTSTGVVLLCNIIPSLCVKILCPFVMHRIPYWVRHTTACTTQVLSLMITAFSESVYVALCGVCLASFSSGLGETTYLGLAGHYSKNTIATWSSGTGMAGIISSFSYAGLTDRRLLALSPAQAMLVMLVVPVLRGSRTYGNNEEGRLHEIEKVGRFYVSLLRYMVPLSLTYFAEYLINQGLLELTVFDCKNGFGTSPASQYRWYQVLYQVGVFVSRSSIKIVQLNMLTIALMPILQFVPFMMCFLLPSLRSILFQLLNTAFFMLNAIYAFVPNFAIVCVIVFYEGLIGGGSYVNTFHHIHKKVDPSIREFALSTVSLADSFGILLAALVSIPVHNAICAMQWYHA
ncbi:unnamed protein product [Angiostrongylus costaricensis]|uniref:Battenin n=1 Tax=Angiostrongylus costaricensis TaxID=334426 RepID=A0A158PG48_ANGCS|nr:unnamed protein product [Angiostrongylus costaricensis]